MQRDDHTLLLAMHRGDQTAAVALWGRHASSLRAYARAILPSADADDAVQDALLRALRCDHATLANVRDVPAWLATLVRRSSLNRVREARRRFVRERASAGGGGDGASDVEAVGRAVACLPRRLREVVVLRHVCGLTFAQCAVALSVNQNTVASRYREATECLRLSLKQPVVPQRATQAERMPSERTEVVHG